MSEVNYFLYGEMRSFFEEKIPFQIFSKEAKTIDNFGVECNEGKQLICYQMTEIPVVGNYAKVKGIIVKIPIRMIELFNLLLTSKGAEKIVPIYVDNLGINTDAEIIKANIALFPQKGIKKARIMAGNTIVPNNAKDEDFAPEQEFLTQ